MPLLIIFSILIYRDFYNGVVVLAMRRVQEHLVGFRIQINSLIYRYRSWIIIWLTILIIIAKLFLLAHTFRLFCWMTFQISKKTWRIFPNDYGLPRVILLNPQPEIDCNVARVPLQKSCRAAFPCFWLWVLPTEILEFHEKFIANWINCKFWAEIVMIICVSATIFWRETKISEFHTQFFSIQPKFLFKS